MKLGSIAKMLAGSTLALMLISGPVVARDHHAKDQKKAALYPDATRKEPKLDLTKQKDADELNKGLNAANAGDTATAKQILEPMAAGTASRSKYVQSLALQGLATMKYQGGDLKGAIADLSKALDIGVMPNDTYFQLMYELSQFYLADQQFDKALATLQKWRTEGKRETADSYALEGNIDYRLQKYSDAIAAIKKAKSMTDKPKASWDQILMASYAESGNTDEAVKAAEAQLQKNPKDATALRNAVSLLVQAQKYPEALKLMEQGLTNGAISTEKDYINTAKLYLVIGQNSSDPTANAKKAYGVIEGGISKGIIKPGYEAYKLEGDAANIAGEYKKAIAAYAKASPMATDGEADLRRGQLLLNENKHSQGRKAVQTAISKGVKHMGVAYMLLAEAERAMKNKPAAIAAMKKAATYPETHKKAEAWLKSAGH